MSVGALLASTPRVQAAQPKIQSSVQAKIQTPIPGQVSDALTLEGAVRRALANNRQISLARLQLQGAELSFRTAWDTMFVPTATLSASSGSSYSLTTLPSPGASEVARDHGYPATSIELNLGTYTLFNFWRDWIVYEQALLDWQRATEIYNESVRAVRFQIINAYFRLKADQEKLDSGVRSVQISDAILELVKSRVRRKQATESDVSSSSVDLLNAKKFYASLESSERNSLWQLNQLLGDPVGTAYQIKKTVKFTPVTLTQALKIFWDQAPTVKNAKRDIKKAELAVELAEKNQLPLPRVSFSGVTFAYQNSYYSGAYSNYGQSAGNTNVGVSAAVALSLPLYGPNGFFNHRLVTQAQIARDSADMSYQDASNRDVVSVYNAFAAFKRDEKTIVNEQQAFEQSASSARRHFLKTVYGGRLPP